MEPLNKKQKLSDNAIILAKKAIANHGMAQNDFFMTSNQLQDPKQSRERSFMACHTGGLAIANYLGSQVRLQ